MTFLVEYATYFVIHIKKRQIYVGTNTILVFMYPLNQNFFSIESFRQDAWQAVGFYFLISIFFWLKRGHGTGCFFAPPRIIIWFTK